MTPKTKKLLDYIVEYNHQHGVSPSYDEMTTAMGLKSKSGIHRMVDSLISENYIERREGKNRGIKVINYHPFKEVMRTRLTMIMNANNFPEMKDIARLTLAEYFQ